MTSVRRFAAGLALLAAGCGGSPVGPGPPPAGPIDLAGPWTVVDPREAGVDVALVDSAIADARAIPRFRSLLAAKDGRLFVEEYFDGHARETLGDVRSITKSVIATLVGIAIDRGDVRGVDQPIGELIPDGVAHLSAPQQAISVGELLTMSAGFEWDESGGGGDYTAWAQSSDPIAFLLERPFAYTPGTRFTYNSAAVHLLGVALQEAVGEPLPRFASRELFQPLGIERVSWESLAGGYVNGGSGLDIRSRDLARLGQLYLQDGVSGERRVLPDGWVGTLTRPAFEWRVDFGALTDYTYAALWWVAEGQPETAWVAWGYGGQFLYVVPELSLVVVATTEWRDLEGDGSSGTLQRGVLGVIVERLHRAVRLGGLPVRVGAAAP